MNKQSVDVEKINIVSGGIVASGCLVSSLLCLIGAGLFQLADWSLIERTLKLCLPAIALIMVGETVRQSFIGRARSFLSNAIGIITILILVAFLAVADFYIYLSFPLPPMSVWSKSLWEAVPPFFYLLAALIAPWLISRFRQSLKAKRGHSANAAIKERA